MSHDLATLIASVVLVVVLVRQFQARKVGWSFWVLPLIPAAFGLLLPGLVDPQHRNLSIALDVAIVAVGVVMGVVYGFTVKVWRDPENRIWSKATTVAIAVWLVVFAARAAVYAAGHAAGVDTGEGPLLFSFGAVLLARTVVVTWRASRLPTGIAVAS
ncbi:hypothetical protein [Actinoplanes philippinensis]|uniref:hypothetical protein n=1 Tax=Actinoplanes philippinensis TaxID=35752 RepID=UPI0033C4AD64